jgi:hypothetical protein
MRASRAASMRSVLAIVCDRGSLIVSQIKFEYFNCYRRETECPIRKARGLCVQRRLCRLPRRTSILILINKSYVVDGQVCSLREAD